MNRTVRALLSLTGGAVASSLFLHWSTSTLSDITRRSWYNDSFLWLFEHSWAVLGIDWSRYDIQVISEVTVYGIHFIVPLIGVVAFLLCSGLWTVKRVGWGALVAALCSVACPVFWIIGVYIPFGHFKHPFLFDWPIMMSFLALCVYVAVPGFWQWRRR